MTAANPPYPNLCYSSGGGCSAGPQDASATDVGLLWLTEPDAGSLATSANPVASYILNLKLSNPATAQAFANRYGNSNNPAAPSLASWQGIAAGDGLLVADEQQVLSPGAWLAGLLALATVAVLAGGRMAERTRRVGLLKAVGGTPGLVTVVLLAENLVVALVAAAAGLAIGWLAAPLITNPGAALVGTPGAPSLTPSIAGLVVTVALAVALAASLVPAAASHTRLSYGRGGLWPSRRWLARTTRGCHRDRSRRRHAAVPGRAAPHARAARVARCQRAARAP